MKPFEAIPEKAKSEATHELAGLRDLEEMELSKVGTENGRSGKLKKLMIAMTASMMIMAPVASSAEQKVLKVPDNSNKIELKNNQEKEKALVMDFLKYVKGMPATKDPQQFLMMKQAIRDNLNLLALKIKIGEQGQSGTVSPEDRRRAVEVISASISEFSDAEFGNNTEKNNLKAYDAMQKDPSMRLLLVILNEYAR